jgi:hypothetical protein
MWDDLRDGLDLVIFANVSVDEEEELRKGNKNSVCISYDSGKTAAGDPVRCDLGFRSFDDFQVASKRADLIFFGSDTPAVLMGGVIRQFLQSDGIIVIDAGSSSVSRREVAQHLPAWGCGAGRVFSLRRLPGACAVGHEEGGDFVTRVYGKLVGEFFECLGRVVVGAEVIVNGPFRKPEGLVGSYMIVALEGAEFGRRAAYRERDLVAVDLSATRIRTLPEEVFYKCIQLAAVAFPAELESIGEQCFRACDALRVVDLANTQLRKLAKFAFAWSGLTSASVPRSLREMGRWVFADTPLKVLDLSACAGIQV